MNSVRCFSQRSCVTFKWFEKFRLNFSISLFVIRVNLLHTILASLRFTIISLVFSYPAQVLFSGFLRFKGNFVDGRNTSKYRDGVPLRNQKTIVICYKSEIEPLLGYSSIQFLTYICPLSSSLQFV